MLMLGICLTIILQSHTSRGATYTRNYILKVGEKCTIKIPDNRKCCYGEYITNIKCETDICRLAIRFVNFDIPSLSNVMLYDGYQYIGQAEWSSGQRRILPKITSSSSAKIQFMTSIRKYTDTYRGIEVKVEAVLMQFTDVVMERWRMKGYLPRETVPGPNTWDLHTIKPDTDTDSSAQFAWCAIAFVCIMAILFAMKGYTKKGSAEENTEESPPRQTRVRHVNRPTDRLTATTSTSRIRTGPLITTRTERHTPVDRPRPATSSSTSRSRPSSFILTRPGIHALPPSSASSSSSNITHSSTGLSNHRNSTQDGALVEAVIVEPHTPTPSPPPYDEALSPSYDPCYSEAPPPPYEDVAGINPPQYPSRIYPP